MSFSLEGEDALSKVEVGIVFGWEVDAGTSIGVLTGACCCEGGIIFEGGQYL